MSLPNELIDQIVSYVHANTPQGFVTHSRRIRNDCQLREVIMDACIQIESCSGEPHFVYVDPDNLSCKLDPSLTALRLVSRAWNHGIARLLAWHWPLTININDRDSIAHALKRCTPQLGGPPRHLELRAGQSTLPTVRIYHDDWRDMLSEADPREEMPSGSFKDWPRPQSLWTSNGYTLRQRIELGIEDCDHSPPACAGDIGMTESIELLQNYLATAAQFEAANAPVFLSVVFPGAESNTDVSAEGDWANVAECFDLEAIRQLLDTTICSSLRLYDRTLFASLTELRLMLPGTCHFSQLHESCPQHIRDTVRRLWVGVTDATGAGGMAEYLGDDHDYQTSSEPWDIFCIMDAQSKDIRASIYAPSNLQLAYPNWEHQSALWEFVASFESLETLAVDCTHFLQLDLLASLLRGEFRRSGRTWQLQKLSLHRVYTDVASLCWLVDSSSMCQRLGSVDCNVEEEQHKLVPPACGPCSIRRLDLDSVKIYADGGNWGDFFDFLRHLDTHDLELIRVNELSYFQCHLNSRQPDRPREDISILWTDSDADSQALRAFLEGEAAPSTHRQCPMVVNLYTELLTVKECLEEYAEHF